MGGRDNKLIETSQIDITLFSPSPWNFNMSTDDEKRELAESVKAEGVAIPILVRSKGKRYEIIDGEQKFTVCRDLLKMPSVPSKWVEVRDMSDDDVRQYIRNSLTRSKNKNLMREAHHYYTDKEARGMSLNEYATSIGKDVAEMSRILSRVNTSRGVQTFIEKTVLPASVVDEILKVHPEYTLDYLEKAESEKWNTVQAREHMQSDRTEDGGSVVENPKTKPYESELKSMSMEERGAVSMILADIITNYGKLSKFLDREGYGELSTYVYGESVKNITKMKNLFEGVHNVIPKNSDKPIYRVNLVRDYVKKGDITQNRLKIDEVVKKINRIIPS